MAEGADGGPRRPRVPGFVRLSVLLLGPAVLPAAASAGVLLLGAGGPSARFRAMLVALVGAAAIGAFATDTLRRALVRLCVAAGLAALVAAVASGPPGRGLAQLVLVLGVGAGAAGLAAFGRQARAPGPTAGTVAFLVLVLAMSGMRWADAAAERLPLERRHPLRQAVLLVDPALAASYDVAGFDRLHAPEVYANVPLASSLYERPDATAAGLAWGVAGVAVAGLGLLVSRWGGGRKGGGAA